jgi:putative FmdB family regulatory protein
MAHYDYECPDHGVFEVVKSVHNNNVPHCPICDKPMSQVWTRKTLPGMKIGKDATRTMK